MTQPTAAHLELAMKLTTAGEALNTLSLQAGPVPPEIDPKRAALVRRQCWLYDSCSNPVNTLVLDVRKRVQVICAEHVGPRFLHKETRYLLIENIHPSKLTRAMQMLIQSGYSKPPVQDLVEFAHLVRKADQETVDLVDALSPNLIRITGPVVI